jgi:trypsin-like peptidase
MMTSRQRARIVLALSSVLAGCGASRSLEVSHQRDGSPRAASSERPWVDAARMTVSKIKVQLPAPIGPEASPGGVPVPARAEPERGSAFIVAWTDGGTVYLVTAMHVVDNAKWPGLAVTAALAAPLCPGELPASVPYTSATRDFAVLSVSLPQACIANLARLRRFPVGRSGGAPLVAVGWNTGDDDSIVASDDSFIRRIEGSDIVLENRERPRMLRNGWSGSPVFSTDGQVIGMVGRIDVAAQEAYVLSYEAIRAQLHAWLGIPILGEGAYLAFRGYPQHSVLTIGEAPHKLGERILVVPGRKPIRVANRDDGFQTVSLDIELVNGRDQRCDVVLLRTRDMRFARLRWQLWSASAGAILAGGVIGGIALATRQDFFQMPAAARLQAVEIESAVADGLFGAGIVGIVAVAAMHRGRHDIGLAWRPRSSLRCREE